MVGKVGAARNEKKKDGGMTTTGPHGNNKQKL